MEDKTPPSIKEEKNSSDKASQEKIPKDTPTSVPAPEKIFVENSEYSVMLTEIQTAQKSLLHTISQAENSMGKMSESLSESLGMIDTQREEIAQLKKERATLEEQKCGFEKKLKSTSQQLTDTSAEVESLKKKIVLLEGELSSEKEIKQSLADSDELKTKQIEEQNSKITDLEQRLKKSLEQDAIAENQELITLKKELSRKLQEAHKDYEEIADQDYSSDLLESHKFLLERIFKMFKRHGITLEEEG